MAARGVAGLLALAALLAASLAACLDRSDSSDRYVIDCVHPGALGCSRVDTDENYFTSSLRIASPSVGHDQRTDTTTLVVAGVVKPLSQCTWVGPLTQPDSELAIRIEPRPRSNETHRTLFLDWRNKPVDPTQNALVALEVRRDKLLKIWDALAAAQFAAWPVLAECLTGDARTTVRRAIALDWPTGVAQSFAARTGFDLGRRNRALVLQPGTRVCALPARNSGDGLGFEPATGPLCAVAANRPDGGTIFDSMLGRVENAFSGEKPGDGAGAIGVNSWPEIDQAKSNFVLVQARNAPRKIGNRLEAHNLTTVVGYRAGSALLPRVLLQCAGQTEAKEYLRDFCTVTWADFDKTTKNCVREVENDVEVSGEKFPEHERPFTCYRFPLRTIVTAEIAIFVQGAPLSVGVGTTLGDIVDRHARAPATIDAAGLPPQGEPADRQAMGLPDRLQIVRRYKDGARPVDFAGAGAAAREMPLLPGDALTW